MAKRGMSLWSCWQDAKRLAGGVVAPAQPDPLADLVSRYFDGNARLDNRAMTDDELEAFEQEVVRPLEDALEAGPPTTRVSVIAALEMAHRELRDSFDKDLGRGYELVVALVDNALAAVKAGAGC